MATTTISNSSTKGLHITLWVLQVVLAALIFMSGLGKITTSIEELRVQAPWVTPALEWLVRFIGISEVAGAIGLILPSVTRIKPSLTVWAALGIMAIMILAFIFHLVRNEYYALPVNLAIGGVAVFIAWARAKKAVIPAR